MMSCHPVRHSLLVIPFLLLAGCTTLAQPDGPQAAADSHIADADEIVRAADWKKMKTVTVTMDQHPFAPQHIVFRVGLPYKLELKNGGDQNHYYTAPEFLRAIATSKALVNRQAEIKAPYFKAFEVAKQGGQLDIYFVPVVQGQYKVYCTTDDHQEQGIDGVLTIE